MNQNLKMGQLDEIFQLPPPDINSSQLIQGEVTNIEEHQIEPIKQEILDRKIEDSNYIRDELKNVISLLKDSLDLAQQEQCNSTDPKASDAVSKLASALAQNLKTLMDLSKIESDKEMKLNEKPKEGNKTINNNLIVANTNDIISMIMEKQKGLQK